MDPKQLCQHGDEKAQQWQTIYRPASADATYHLRHGRIVSEGAMRVLEHVATDEVSERARPRSQISYVNIRKMYNDKDGVQGKPQIESRKLTSIGDP